MLSLLISLLIILAIFATATTRLISYQVGVPLSLYLVLLPLFGVSLLSMRRIVWRRLDIAVAGLVALPIVWTPISSIIALEYYPAYPWPQFFKQIFLGTMLFLPYFAVRFLPIRRPDFALWAFMGVMGLAAIVVYLQQAHLVGQFYAPDEVAGLTGGFRDQSGNILLRNSSFFGNWHDAGTSLLLFFLALYAMSLHAGSAALRWLGRVAMVPTVGAIFLTNARFELAATALTLITWHLVAEPIMKASGTVFVRNVGRVSMILCGLAAAAWGAFLLWGEFFANTFLLTAGLAGIEGQSRLAENIASVDYLLSDFVRGLFGWGLGSGGVPANQGEVVVPVNVVDLSITINLASYGLLGVALTLGIMTFILHCLFQMREHTLRLSRLGVCSSGVAILNELCLLGVWAGLLGYFASAFFDIRVFSAYLFLCLGTLMNAYDRVLSHAPADSGNPLHARPIGAA